AIGSTQPMVRRRIGIEAWVTSATFTATAGLPLSCPGAPWGAACCAVLAACAGAGCCCIAASSLTGAARDYRPHTKTPPTTSITRHSRRKERVRIVLASAPGYAVQQQVRQRLRGRGIV